MLVLVVLTTMVLIVVAAVSVGSVAPSVLIEIGPAPSSFLLSVALFHIDEVLFLGSVHHFVGHSHVLDVYSTHVDLRELQKLLAVG